MDKFQHPFIVCHHKLKLTSLEQLGRHLAVKSNLTIQIVNEDGFKITFEPPKSIYSSKLKISSSSSIPQLKFELLLNDFRLIFFEDFIEILMNFKVDYYHLLDLHKRNELKEFMFFVNFFEILNSFGVKEIYIGIFEEFGNGKKFKYKWKNVVKEIITVCHFKVSI